jgi:5-methyltetrahydrofolate corrinoid/iron sulfur protein methyltransferase
MLIIAERINSSRKPIARAIEAHDVAFIQNEAKRQTEAGCDYIDVNAGTFLGHESEYLKWIIDAIQQVTDRPLSIDSPDPQTIRSVVPLVDKPPMINSITLDLVHLEEMLPIVIERRAKVIALCQSENKMAESIEEKLEIAAKLVEKVTDAGISIEDLYIDPLVYPISTNQQSAVYALTAIKQIMATHPGVHTTCGLTNVSYGLPERKLVNRTFLVAAITHGLDSAIFDPTDKKLFSSLITALAVIGKDSYCTEYITAFRNSRLD